ncbi:MAG: sulfite exporter TauE/SafE family protein [Burkholderiales bacterium]|jgi:hypothetical protein|nr:sulfite exporter TauE/SafE family protein [Burkholderiales bacterium]
MAGMESLPVWGYVWIAFVMLLSGFTHGVIGFGFPIVATPLIALATDIKTAILVVLLPTLTMTIISVFRGGNLRESIGRFWYMPLLLMAGSYAGTRLLIGADPAPFTLVLALVMLAWLNMDRLGKVEVAVVKRWPTVTAVLFGLLAGIFEATANVAGPLLIIYFMLVGIAPQTMIQALNFCFTAGKGTQLFAWSTAGGITLAQWASTLPWAGLAVVTLVIGQHVRGRVSPTTYVSWLRKFLWAMAILLIGQFAWTMLKG